VVFMMSFCLACSQHVTWPHN